MIKRQITAILLAFSLAVAALLLLLGHVQLGTVALLLSGFAATPLLKRSAREVTAILLAFSLAVVAMLLLLGHVQFVTIALLLSGFGVVSALKPHYSKRD